MRMISDRLNPLLGRREILLEVLDQATPSRGDVRKELASTLKVDIERVWVRRLETKTGTQRTIGLAHIYENVERGLKIEPKHIIIRNKPELRGGERKES